MPTPPAELAFWPSTDCTREQGLDLRRVFRKPTVANLHETELALDHTERVFDLGPDARLELLDVLGQRIDRVGLVQ